MTNKKEYAQFIWEHIVSYTLFDFLTAVVLTGTLYLLTKLVCAVTRVGEPYCHYAMQSIKLLGLIYIASILVTSSWRHIRLLRQFVESEAKGDTSPKDKKTDSTNGSIGEGEAKC